MYRSHKWYTIYLYHIIVFDKHYLRLKYLEKLTAVYTKSKGKNNFKELTVNIGLTTLRVS